MQWGSIEVNKARRTMRILIRLLPVLLLAGAGTQAWAGSADLEGTLTYSIDRDRITIEIERIANNTSDTTTGSLYVTVYMTADSDLYSGGYQVARHRITGSSNGQLGPGQYFGDIRWTLDYEPPPPGTYYVHFFTSQHPEPDTVLDSRTFTGTLDVAERGGPADIEGRIAYTISGDDITVEIDRIANNTSSTTTGTLYVTVRMTASNDVFSTGYRVARHRITGDSNGQLDPGHYFGDIRWTLDFSRPPAGTYYVHFYTSQHPEPDTVLDSRTFTNTQDIGGGGGGGGDDHGNSRSTATRVALPSTTTGAIDPGNDTDWFRFEVSSRGSVVMESSGDLDTLGTLFDASGNRIVQDDDGGEVLNFRIERTLDAGTYYVRVHSYQRATGGYTLHLRGDPDDPNVDRIDDVDLGIPAQCGLEVEVCVRDYACEDGDEVRVSVNNAIVFEGEIFNRWQCQSVPVNEGANSISFLALNGTGFKGAACSHADVNTGELRITARGGDAETQRWRHSGGAGSEANLEITVGPRSNASCSLGTDDDTGGGGGSEGGDHGNSRATATRVALPSTTTGTIDPGDDTDYFHFDVPARGAVTMESSGDLDTLGTLFDASGNRIVQDDDGGDGLNFRIERTLDAGAYYVRVHSYQRATGDYTLHLRDAPDDPNVDRIDDVDLGIPAQCGLEVEVCVRDYAYEDGDEVRVSVNNAIVFEGEIFNRWQCQSVPVNEGANSISFLALNGTGFKGAACSHADVNTGELRVTARGGDAETQRWRHRGGAGSEANLEITVGPRSNASCSLGTDDDSGGGGGSGGGDHGNSRATATRIALPSTTTGTIDPGRDTDWFRFEVPARGAVTMESSGELDTLGTLFDASGNRMVQDDDGAGYPNFRIERTLDAGTYYVRVHSYQTATGDYTLHLRRGGSGGGGAGGDDHGNSRGTATRVALPSTTTGTIDPGNDTDWFRFEVSTRGSVTMESSGDLDTLGTLFDASGNRIVQDDDGAGYPNFRIERTLDAGTYYVRVHSYQTATGDYTLHLQGDPQVGGNDEVNFVAVTYAGIATSSDGTRWKVEDTSLRDFENVAYGDGLWVAVDSGTIAVSEDGRNWTSVVSEDSSDWDGDFFLLSGVAFGDGRWTAVGSNAILTSTDGMNWSVVYGDAWEDLSNLIEFTADSVDYGNGLWVAVGVNDIFESVDGQNWRTLAYSEHNGCGGLSSSAVAFGDGHWYTSGYGTGTVACTRTSSGWTPFIEGRGSFGWDIEYGGGDWVAVGNSGVATWNSGADTWSWVELPCCISAVAYRDGQWVVDGYYNSGDPRELADWTRQPLRSEDGEWLGGFDGIASKP